MAESRIAGLEIVLAPLSALELVASSLRIVEESCDDSL